MQAPITAKRPGRARFGAVRVFAKQQQHRKHEKSGVSQLKYVIAAEQFDKHMLSEVFEVANEMKTIKPGTPESNQLQGRVMSALFYEPSTRTRLSFEAAMLKLGGTVTGTENAGQYSSAAKGETLEGVHKHSLLASFSFPAVATASAGIPLRILSLTVQSIYCAQTPSEPSNAIQTSSSCATF